MIRNAVNRASLAPLSAAAILFALSLNSASAIATEPNTIVLENFHFAPASLTIAAGTTVTWENLDEESHTVVSPDGLFRSSGLERSDKFSFTFDKAGTYRFVCSIHPQMIGTIIVK